MQSGLAKTPIFVLSGFLGSGKTTLLNRLLKAPEFSDTAVVVNELGEIGIDHVLISAVENVVLLDSGCLCCGLGESLRETLFDLHARRALGQLPPFARIVVETTGLADPAPILQSILQDTQLRRDFELAALIVIVDAQRVSAQLAQYPEARTQIALADRLVLSKTDLATEAECSAACDAIRAINPVAPIDLARDVSGEPAALAAHKTFPSGLDRYLGEATVAARHSADVRTRSFVLHGPIHHAGVAAWSGFAREIFGARLLRCKGIVAVEGEAGPVLIQSVQGHFAAPERLGGWTSDDRRSRLMCIVDGLDLAVLDHSMRVFDTAPGTFRPASLEELMALPARRPMLEDAAK